MSICPPQGDSTRQQFHQEQRSSWETNKEGPSLIAGSKVPHPAWGHLCALDKKNISTTCVDPVDLEDSYYDHACLDPGSLDADALLQDRSDYMQKNLECCRCLSGKNLPMIYLIHLLSAPTDRT